MMARLAHPTPQLILAFEDGGLGPEAMAFWESHFAACPECERALEGIRTLDTMLAAPSTVAAPSGFAHRVMTELSPEPPLTRSWREGWIWTPEMLAPVLVAAVGVALLAQLQVSGDRAVAPHVTWTTIYGAIAAVVCAITPYWMQLRRPERSL